MYRVSKDTAQAPTRALSGNVAEERAKERYDIFVIMLPDTCPSVTTAPGNKLPRTFFLFTLRPCARACNTSRARNQRVGERCVRRVFMGGKRRARRKRDLYVAARPRSIETLYYWRLARFYWLAPTLRILEYFNPQMKTEVEE